MGRGGIHPRRDGGRVLRRAAGLLLAGAMLLQPVMAFGAPSKKGGCPAPPVAAKCCAAPARAEPAPVATTPERLDPSRPCDDEPAPCCPEGCRRCPRSCCGGAMVRAEDPVDLGAGVDPAAPASLPVPPAAAADRDGVFHPPRA